MTTARDFVVPISSPLTVSAAILLVSVLNVGRAIETAALLATTVAIVILSVFLDHGDGRELTQELAGIQYEPAMAPALETGIDEARQTLDAQIDNLNDIDTKAIRILRVNVLLIGVILSVLTFSSQTEAVPLEDLLNTYVGAGVFLLVSSTAAAALTYTASDVRAGMSTEDVVTMLQEDMTEDELELVLSKSYAKWIRDNQSTEVLDAFYSTTTVLLLIYSVTYLSLGIYRALLGPAPLLLEGVANVALLTITLVSGYPSQTRRAVTEVDLQFG